MSRRKVTSSIYFVPIILTVLLIGGLYLAKQRTGVLSQPETSQIDNVDDGVYTNYKYGYTFGYPTGKFQQTFSDAEGASWDYTLSVGNYHQLNVSILNDDFFDSYEKLSSLKVGESLKIKHNLATKISSKNVNGVDLVIAKVATVPGSETESVSGYEAVWLINSNNSISLNFYGVNADIQLFNQIVESFEFTK